MTRWLVVLVLACPGCDYLLDLRHLPGTDALPQEAIDAGANARCSPMSMVADDFADDDLGILWPGHLNVTETGGHAVMDLVNTTFAELTTGRLFDIRDDSFSVQISDDGIDDTDSISLDLVSQHGHPPTQGYGLRITLVGSTLAFYRVENGVALAMGTAPYDAVQDLYWRIANSAGVTSFEFSPDGNVYTTAVTYPGLDYVNFMAPVITAGRGQSAIFMAYIDDVNHGTSIGNACAASSLTDDFNGAAFADLWGVRSSATVGTLSQHDGVAELAFTPDIAGVNVVLTPATSYDLRDSAFAVEVPQMIDASPGSGQMFDMSVATYANDIVQFSLDSGGGLQAAELKAGAPSTHGVAPYDPIAQRWLRIRASGNIVFWDVSANGIDYTTFGTTNDITGLDRVDMQFQVYGTTTTTGSLVIDNLNLPP